ncbi:hypothetical protein EF53_224 [Enterococcus phage 53]|nr:hypothetical protein EF53_224 [Enterococcus phage 53]
MAEGLSLPVCSSLKDQIKQVTRKVAQLGRVQALGV